MHYDIVIVGGGMVGAAFACAMQNTTLRIALIDAAASHTNDHRLIALNHSSCTLFENLNLWSQLQPHACAIDEVHVSHRGHFGTTRLIADEMKVNHLGHVVPAKYINLTLYEKLAALSNLTIVRPAKLIALTQNETNAELTININETIQVLTANIVIGADGTYSTVRELLGITTEKVDYQQKALVTVTELYRNHHHIAYERFVANGAIAMLPLNEQRVATIWSGNEKEIDDLLKLSDEEFLSLLQQQFGYRLGKLLKTQQRFSYPLKLIKAREHIKQHTVLVGNAAHTIHPIAAQGLNLALYEIAVIAEHLSETLSLANLPNYLAQQNASINLSHQITQLFSTDFFVVNAVRQMGMIGLDLCSLAKQQFGKKVLGKTGSLPKLLMGI